MQAGALIAGKYLLKRIIGKGAMGVVWEAIHEGTSRPVAVKLILEPTDELRHRLDREARAYGALRHRNIVEILDVGLTDDGDPFLVMQLLTGETLADRLTRQRRLGTPEATRIARDVARGLAAAHAQSIIHRDLKPANIFLHDEQDDEPAVVKVVDFGVSKNLLSSDGLSTVVGGIVGSPAYASPEQAAGGTRGPVDHRADVWSLGVVLFEMLTGVRPLQGDAITILPQIMTAEIPLVTSFVRSIDPKLAALVARCLERDLTKRVASAADLALLLNGYTTASQGAGSAPLGQSSSGWNTPAAPPSRSDAALLVSPRAPFASAASVPEREPPAAVIASPRAAFASISERDPSARSPRPQGGLLAAGPSMPGAGDNDNDDEEQATARLSPHMLQALRPAAKPVAAPQMSPRDGRTVPMQSDAALPPYRAPMPSQLEVPPPPSSFKTTLPLQDNPMYGSGSSWPAQTPMTAKLDPSAPWGAPQPSVTEGGTVRISPEDLERIRSAGAAASPQAPLPAPPAPGQGLSSVSGASSFIQQNGGDPSSASQAAALAQQQKKQRRTPLLVAGSVVGVALAIAAVVVVRSNSSEEEKPATIEAAATSTSVAPVVSATAPTATATAAPSATEAPTAEPVVSAKPIVIAPHPPGPVKPSLPLKGSLTGVKPSAGTSPAPGSKPGGSKGLPGFLKNKKADPTGI